MYLAEVLDYLYPGAADRRDYLVQADETGERSIAYWNESVLGMQPTGQALQDLYDQNVLPALKAVKERELRDASNAWYQSNVRPFEGVVVVYKAATGAALAADEIATRNAMSTNYSTLRNKVQQVRNATTVDAVLGVVW